MSRLEHSEASGRVTALLVAGGRGARFGGGEPKQFRILGDRPLLAHAAAALVTSPLVDAWILVVPAGFEAAARTALQAAGVLHKLQAVVPGGATRQDSVWEGLAAAADATHVLVHDAARPFLTQGMIRDALAAARRTGACTVAVPVADTLVRGRPETPAVAGMLDRTGAWSVQTPQAFAREVLHAAHEQARERGLAGTDDAGLVHAIGHPVELVHGTWWNLKVTQPEDWARAEILLALRAQLEAAG